MAPDVFEGFYFIKNLTVFISEKQYWQYVSAFGLHTHSHNLKELHCASRIMNYVEIEKKLTEMYIENPKRFEFKIYNFLYMNEQAQEVISDFLTKYIILYPYISIRTDYGNSGELPYPYGKDFDLVCSNNGYKSILRIKIDDIIRLVGNVRDFMIVFKNDTVYNFRDGEVYIASSGKYSDAFMKNEFSTTNSNSADESRSKEPAKKRFGIHPMFALAAIMVCAVVLLIVCFYQDLSGSTVSSSKTDSTYTAGTQNWGSPVKNSYPVVKAGNGECFVKPSNEGICPLEVQASSDSDYYIYLKFFKHSKKTDPSYDFSNDYGNDIAFYVKAGQVVDIDIPVGIYIFYYCTGKTFYGPTHLFGDDTISTKASNLMEFYVDDSGAVGKTITLYPVPDGNLHTQSIDYTDFPKAV